MPERIQLSRAKGWRKPPGAIVVARPSRWGNPWRIFKRDGLYRVEHLTEDAVFAAGLPSIERARQDATTAYRMDLFAGRLAVTLDDVELELAGHDLACWCPPSPLTRGGGVNWLGLRCHADVLLELAND